jgi:hypothetical protein
MHYIVSSLCHAGGIFKMLRPLQGLFVLVNSSTVCKTALSYSTTILAAGGTS